MAHNPLRMNLGANKKFLAALLCLHFVLALAYAFQTPYRTAGLYFSMGQPTKIPDIGAPDERQHANYVQWLLNGEGFKVLDPKDPQLGEHYQAHQPPLFYLIAAGFCEITGQHDVSQKGTGLALRGLNAVIGTADILGVYFLGWWGFKRRDIALAGAAFAALLPMNLALSGAISNDPLLYCLCSWCLAVTALCLSSGWTTKRCVAIGILLGAAMLTKTTAIGLVPALLVAAYVSAPRPAWKHIGTAAAIALVLALPWWLRNQSLYGDPFAMKAFNEAFKGSPTRESLHADWPRYIGAVFTLTWMSFVGVFGYMEIGLPDLVSRVAAGVFLILALGAFLALRHKEWKEHRAVHVLNGAFIAIVLVLYAAFNYRYFQGQARYIFPALGPISIGFGLGVLYFGKDKWRTSLIAYVVVLTALNLYIITQILPPEFAARMARIVSS